MEKRLARELVSARADFFLPLHWEKRPRQDRGRTRFVEKFSPLFPSYIFINGDASREIAAHSTAKATIYPVSEKTQPILQLELSDLYVALNVNPWLGVGPEFREGDRVRVIAGPFMGLEGILERRAAGHRVHLSVAIMGRSVPLDLPEEFIGEAFFN